MAMGSAGGDVELVATSNQKEEAAAVVDTAVGAQLKQTGNG